MLSETCLDNPSTNCNGEQDAYCQVVYSKSLLRQGWNFSLHMVQLQKGFSCDEGCSMVSMVDDLEPIWKQKWMANGICELIMMSKTIIPIKHEPLATALIFWNNGTNTFDFKIGPITPTILDMAQAFNLRPSGRCVDITHDWSSPSCLTAESSEASKSITSQSTTPPLSRAMRHLLQVSSPSPRRCLACLPPTTDQAQEHKHFLLYWLNKYVFRNKSKGVKLEQIP